MPKVNADYFSKKNTQILEAAFKIFQQKPLYEITMLDVIKEAGLSKGGIYRYFGAFAPLLAAVTVIVHKDGWSGVRKYFRQAFNF